MLCGVWKKGFDMHPTLEAAPLSGTMGEAEREKVREQLQRLLETHHFRNSKRYPALLRFIVEETLEGRGEFLKERLIGVQVFDRPADYDTATDPVVRVTIAEIRKRIAQYYHDEAHDAEMRIELLPGRYTPEFRPRVRREFAETMEGGESRVAHEPPGTVEPAAVVEASAIAAAPEERVVAAGEQAERGRASRGRPGWVVMGVPVLLVAIVLLAGAAGLWRWMQGSAVDALWAPMLEPGRPVLFCVPTKAERAHGPLGDLEENVNPAISSLMKAPGTTSPGTTYLAQETLGQNVVFSDMQATLRMVGVLAARRRDYRLKLNVDTNLDDLRQGPTVLVGGLDNQWTMRALVPLRFRFAGDGQDRYWVADAKNPGSRAWTLDLRQQSSAVTQDYAIIARLHNEQTGQVELIVAGIGMSGTAAAGEYVSDPGKLEELRARIGPALKDKDFEVVLGTDVVSGIAGSPKVLATEVW